MSQPNFHGGCAGTCNQGRTPCNCQHLNNPMNAIPTRPSIWSRIWRSFRRRLQLLDCYSQLSGAHRDLADTQREIDELEVAQFADISTEAKARRLQAARGGQEGSDALPGPH